MARRVELQGRERKDDFKIRIDKVGLKEQKGEEKIGASKVMPAPVTSSDHSSNSSFNPSKKIVISKDTELIKANALGDDRNLINHGTKDPHYQYSVNDAMHLLEWIRKQYLEPVFFTSTRVEDRGSFSTENTSDILLTEPYHQDNFVASLTNDISRITGTGTFEARHKWFNMPKTIIIPVLSSGHWRSVTITIDYNEQIKGIYKVNILFDDPFGQGRFPTILKKLYSGIIERQVEKLIQIQDHITYRPILNVTEEDREGDQQGSGENVWDCGPIILSNIEDHIRYHQPENHEELYCQYLLPEYSLAEDHASIMTDIRVRDISRYNETEGVPIDEVRFQAIKEQFVKSRALEYNKIKKLGLESSLTEIIDWDAVYIDMFFAVIQNKRSIESTKTLADPYTHDEIKYAFQLVLQERDKIVSLEAKKKGLPSLQILSSSITIDEPTVIAKQTKLVTPFEIILKDKFNFFTLQIKNNIILLKYFYSAAIKTKDIHALGKLFKFQHITDIISDAPLNITSLLFNLKILTEPTTKNKQIINLFKKEGITFIDKGNKIIFANEKTIQSVL